MKDLPHNHFTIGVVEGCPACEQIKQASITHALDVDGRPACGSRGSVAVDSRVTCSTCRRMLGHE